VMSPVTLLARHRDRRRIHAARQRLAAPQPVDQGDAL